MLYREIIAVCSQIHTKHINTLCGQNAKFVNVKLAVHIVTTGLQTVNSFRCSIYRHSTRTARYQLHPQHIRHFKLVPIQTVLLLCTSRRQCSSVPCILNLRIRKRRDVSCTLFPPIPRHPLKKCLHGPQARAESFRADNCVAPTDNSTLFLCRPARSLVNTPTELRALLTFRRRNFLLNFSTPCI